MTKRILVPVDFSEASLQALDYAIELGRPLRAEFVLLYAVEPLYYPMPGGMFGAPAYDMGTMYQEFERAGREQLSRLAAKLHKRRLVVRTLLRVGTASEVILQMAKKLKVDLVVMSTHGRTGLAHVVLGSVTERVVRSAPCPVLTVRAHKSARRPASRRLRAKTRPAGRRAARAANGRTQRQR